MRCVGTENELSECSHLPFRSHNCAHREDAGVACTSTLTLSNGNVVEECIYIGSRAHLKFFRAEGWE